MPSVMQLAVPRPRLFPGAHYHARTFLEQSNTGKALARDRLTQIVQRLLHKGESSNGQPIYALTMPGVWWHFEKNLIRRFGNSRRIRFTGVEQNAQVFSAASLSMPFTPEGFRVLADGKTVSARGGFTLVHARMSDYLKACSKPFRLAWLDYYSPISKAVLADIRRLSQIMPKDGSILIAVNVMIGRETKEITNMRKEHQMREVFLADYLQEYFGPLALLQRERYREDGQTVTRLQLAMGRGNLEAERPNLPFKDPQEDQNAAQV